MYTPDRKQSQETFICPRTGKVFGPQPQKRWTNWLLPLTGLACLIWFLIRVVPKPSRALYPCQRMAFPVASGFIVWLLGFVTMVIAFRKAKTFGRQHRAVVAVTCLAIAAIAGVHTLINLPAQPALAGTDLPNSPIGAAKGVSPGRVVWAHNPDATNFAGEYNGDGHWWELRHTNQAAIDKMLSVTLRKLTATNSDQAAWDAIFHYYNSTHGRGDVGYTPGEKITIKVNLVASADWKDGRVNLATYVQSAYVENVTVSPWMMLSLLRQLVYKAGVAQQDISIGDTMCFFVSQHWDACHSEFPNVQYLDVRGLCGRIKTASSAHRFHWSNGATAANADYTPQSNAAATYFINFANLKWHEGGGITGCGKNYYGSLIRKPGDTGYYELHGDLPFSTATMGRYRTLTDLMAHSDFGYGKGILWLLDGLWGGVDAGTRPVKWNIPPFNYDWPSSLLVSQDPVAIDSVALDACKADAAVNTTITNPAKRYPITSGAADDYLHEAALIDNPPSGTFYDPDHRPPSVRRSSLGVHEHWNNSIDRQYSRNLGTGGGIELMWLETAKRCDVNFDNAVGVADLQYMVTTWASAIGSPAYNPDADFNSDGTVNIGDLQRLVQDWGM